MGPSRVEEMNSNSDKLAVYLIGRGADVHIRIDDTSVSRIHAELVVTKTGDLFLTDRASSGGTYVARNGAWKRISQDFVKRAEALLLGRHQTTLGKILKEIEQGTGKQTTRTNEAKEPVRKNPELPLGPVRRNPETGEVISDH